MAILLLLGSLSATILIYGLGRLCALAYRELVSPLKNLPGPKSKSIIYGHFKEIWEAENSVLHEKWVEEYGNTIQYKGLFGMRRLFTMDTRALNHVLMNSYNYQKPAAARYNLSRVVGPGLLVVEEDKHKLQRKIMVTAPPSPLIEIVFTGARWQNPAFGAAQVRELTEIFVEKSIQLREKWANESSKQGGTARVDVLSWLSRTTLDIIGLAGFNYKFHALDGDKPNELNEAFATSFRSGTSLSLIPVIRAWIPALRFLPAEKDAEIKVATDTMSRIGRELIDGSKKAMSESMEKGDSASKRATRDLLSLLVRANTATDLPASQRLDDQDILAQVPTFLAAGHETTSTGTTWALYALTQNIEVQNKLREELFTVSTDNPTMDELNALPYLDAVVRETMRVHAPVPSTIRVAMKDDVVPLNEPFRGHDGILHDEVRITAGQTIIIPILAMNRAKSIWGEDSHEFRPERWASVPEAASTIPGIWGNMLTFLGGPRACIGYKFSLVEMKALLFTLIRAFEFELAVPAKDIIKKSAIVQRPLVASDPKGGNQMPLLITPYHRES
ncbi:cytochrome P450 [Infundibulicybe gibba]|nr:cytochrome P450 [Infundibulicybe gibba]